MLLFILRPGIYGQTLIEYEYLSELKKFNVISPDSLWRYHPGDKSEWANSTFNDKDWQLVYTQLLLDRKRQSLRWCGIGWFRQHFTIHDSLRGKPVALLMGQFGASEIYLDGKLIQAYGIVSTTSSDEITYVPRKPFFVQLDDIPTHTLAVRYSNYLSGKLTSLLGFVDFSFVFVLQNWLFER